MPFKFLENIKIFNKYNVELNSKQLLKYTKVLILFFGCKLNKNEEIIKCFQEMYKFAKYKGHHLEIIFISTDENREDMEETYRNYHSHWFTAEFSPILFMKLQQMYNIRYTPTVIVIRNNGTLITKNGIKEILKLKENVVVSWF